MLYKIVHLTTYSYSRFVDLEPHTVRLRARSCGFQSLRAFSLEVTPEAAGVSEVLDWEGNNTMKLWFTQPTNQLSIKITSEVETHCTNPFNYLVEPWAMQLPITDYPAPVLAQLAPYLQPITSPVIMELAQEIWQATNGQTVNFLSELNQRIYQNCEQTVRETGDPFPAGITWNQKLGSCRDMAIIFIEACRAFGLAARFVSGYQEGVPEQEERHLHAWAEVYLPGAGWLGYDPTQGLVVSDRHIVLAASAIPRYAAPISGNFRGAGVTSDIQYTLSIQIIS
ncbi:transglutaminase family protein [Kamptonema animale CS-326]|jgi:transglutaminase-like putative cysteine protease|uniref:transglutaminase family protein n=1 Tax=Kamptonema animale TaxID=92934 RepID=UPI002330516A|nr:transglutaminase family protein [Kamptonema animale]MDB9510525.1 transglutaminase family protein [Kamptonema animale CS-326]